MTSEGREGERAIELLAGSQFVYTDPDNGYRFWVVAKTVALSAVEVARSEASSPEADGGDGRADERAVPRVPDPSEDTGTCGHAAEGAEAGHRPLKHLIADVMRVTSDPRILTPLFEIAQRANPSSPEPSSEGERWRIYVCDRCDALSETPLDGYACPGWEGTGREDHIGRQVEVARASEASSLRAQVERDKELRKAVEAHLDLAQREGILHHCGEPMCEANWWLYEAAGLVEAGPRMTDRALHAEVETTRQKANRLQAQVEGLREDQEAIWQGIEDAKDATRTMAAPHAYHMLCTKLLSLRSALNPDNSEGKK